MSKDSFIVQQSLVIEQQKKSIKMMDAALKEAQKLIETQRERIMQLS